MSDWNHDLEKIKSATDTLTAPERTKERLSKALRAAAALPVAVRVDAPRPALKLIKAAAGVVGSSVLIAVAVYLLSPDDPPRPVEPPLPAPVAKPQPPAAPLVTPEPIRPRAPTPVPTALPKAPPEALTAAGVKGPPLIHPWPVEGTFDPWGNPLLLCSNIAGSRGEILRWEDGAWRRLGRPLPHAVGGMALATDGLGQPAVTLWQNKPGLAGLGLYLHRWVGSEWTAISEPVPGTEVNALRVPFTLSSRFGPLVGLRVRASPQLLEWSENAWRPLGEPKSPITAPNGIAAVDVAVDRAGQPWVSLFASGNGGGQVVLYRWRQNKWMAVGEPLPVQHRADARFVVDREDRPIVAAWEQPADPVHSGRVLRVHRQDGKRWSVLGDALARTPSGTRGGFLLGLDSAGHPLIGLTDKRGPGVSVSVFVWSDDRWQRVPDVDPAKLACSLRAPPGPMGP